MFDLRTASPSLSLPHVIGNLRIAIAAWGGRRMMAVVLVLLVHRRLGEICGRLERMLARFQAGRAMCRRPGVRADLVVGVSAAPAVEAGVRRERVWPVGFGWLLLIGTHEAAGHGEHLRHVLAHPDMAALLDASPQARRLLRPVCRMLGVEASLLREPVVVAVVKVPRVRRKAVRVELPPLRWPRGVLAMSRKYKKQGRW